MCDTNPIVAGHSGRRLFAVPLLCAVAFALVALIGAGSAPAQTTINACVKKKKPNKGAVLFKKKCPKGYKATTINQTGPPGPAGPTGASGAAGGPSAQPDRPDRRHGPERSQRADRRQRPQWSQRSGRSHGPQRPEWRQRPQRSGGSHGPERAQRPHRRQRA